MAQEKYRKTEKRPQKSPVKKNISSEEKKRREAKRREEARIAAENRRRAKIARKKRRTRIFALSFALSLVFVVIYWAWVAFSIVSRDAISEDALPLLVYTDGERKEDLRFEAEEVTFGDNVFLPVTVLEEYTAISIFGDYDTRSFLIGGGDEYATFTLGSCNVLVNGQKVSMKASAFLKDDVLYIPIDFFTDKMTCFSYTHSSALAAGVLTYLPEGEMNFIFREMPDSPTVDIATAPVIPTVSEDPEAA
ncbi:MAG: hypothetical protein IKT50_02395 [Clostridia bacterium]|nr:hypothetical protein [Clostridia bacterium]